MGSQLEGYRIVLGSSSPRRYEIVTGQMHLDNVTVLKPREELDKTAFGTDSLGYLRANCRYKVDSIVPQLEADMGKSIVLCADTIVVDNDGHVLEKPVNEQEQLCNLRRYQASEKPILVHTCVELLLWEPHGHGHHHDNVTKRIQFVETTELQFNKHLPLCVLEEYVASGEGLLAAGGFNIQGQGGVLIESIQGDFYNVVGLPLSRTVHAMWHLASLCSCSAKFH